MKKIVLITGGQRSGKSAFAERMALKEGQQAGRSTGGQVLPLVYMATAHVEDDEFRERVRLHQERRGPEWETIEEEKQLSRHDVTGRVVLVDSCTLWLSNFWEVNGSPLLLIEEEFDRLTAQDATFIFVTDEVGLGGTSVNDVQRRFTDWLGTFNQYVAARADEVFLIVAGIPMKIKG